MLRSNAKHAGWMRRLGLCASGASALSLLVIAPPARSIEGVSEPVVRVEEDWQLVMNEPDENVDSPQFHTVMSPYDHVDTHYAQVLWNYRETPDYTAGGVQLQSYDGDYLIRTRSVEYRQLSTSAEAIRWTQSLQTDGATLTFSVFNGTSTTWGSFGRDMVIDFSASLNDLGGYSPDASASNSCVTYGTNRVDSLSITEVRYYGADGSLLYTDSNPRVVFQYEE